VNGHEVKYVGVTFANVRAALCATYFMYDDMPEEEWRKALEYVVPAQHNFQSPIEPGSQDTWIQFWIDEDDRLTQDYNYGDQNQTEKMAQVAVRFLGDRAEIWAKMFHHLTKRRSVARYFREFCNGNVQDYISPIIPVNVDYFGVGNTTRAFDTSFSIAYSEVMTFDSQPLDYISFAPGEMGSGE